MPRLTKPIDVSQTFGKSTQTKLRKFYRIQNPSLPVRIRPTHLIEALGVSDSDGAYAAIAELYNKNVRTKNDEITALRTTKQEELRLNRNKKARDTRAAKKNPPVVVETPVKYIPHIDFRAVYYRPWYDIDTKHRFLPGDVIEYRLDDESEYTNLPSKIKDFLYDKYDKLDDGYKISTITSYTIETIDIAHFEGPRRTPVE